MTCKIIAALLLLAGVVAGLHALLTGEGVQRFGLCLFIGAACAAWFQSE